MSQPTISRRHVLGMAVTSATLLASGGVDAVFAEALKRTPGEILGPFYPVLKHGDAGTDLTRLPGKPGRAGGQLIHVMGRILNVDGQPVRNGMPPPNTQLRHDQCSLPGFQTP